MSLFWPAGQIFTAILGWLFITNESICKEDCKPESRFDGWRGVVLVVGITTALIACIRVLVFRRIESPKFSYIVQILIRKDQEWGADDYF
jgi:MFS family permease